MPISLLPFNLIFMQQYIYLYLWAILNNFIVLVIWSSFVFTQYSGIVTELYYFQ